jgi:hypothetical protein
MRFSTNDWWSQFEAPGLQVRQQQVHFFDCHLPISATLNTMVWLVWSPDAWILLFFACEAVKRFKTIRGARFAALVETL